MGYQVPRADHPWRRNANAGLVEKPEPENKKSVRLFIQELVESWDNIEIYTYSYGREGKYLLNDLSQTKQAAWIMGILRRGYHLQ